MHIFYYRHLLLATILASVSSFCDAQELHSSVEPTHIVNWEAIGLYSSLNPEKWVNGEKAIAIAKKENAPLKVPTIPYRSETDMPKAEQSQPLFQAGVASYYSAKMHGRKMSNGTAYDKNALTCAHRTLPFGTKIRVVNKKNGKETIVKVTDRGPFGKGRVIDLSNKAASEIDMIRDGIAQVELYIVNE